MLVHSLWNEFPCYLIQVATFRPYKIKAKVVAWSTRWTCNVRIASCMGSNPVKGKQLFP